MPTTDKSYTKGYAKQGTKVKFCDTWTTQYIPYLLHDTDVRKLSKNGRIDQMSLDPQTLGAKAPAARYYWENFIHDFFGIPGPGSYWGNLPGANTNWTANVQGKNLKNPLIESISSPYSLKAANAVKWFFLNGIDLLRYQFGFYYIDGNKIHNQDNLLTSTWINEDTNFSSLMGQTQPPISAEGEDTWKICDALGVGSYGGFHYIGRIDPDVDQQNQDLVKYFEDPAWNGPTRLERFAVSINDDDFASPAGPYFDDEQFKIDNGSITGIGGQHVPWYYSQMQFTAYTDFLNLAFSTISVMEDKQTLGGVENTEIFTPIQSLGNGNKYGSALLAKRLDFRKAAASWWFNNIIMVPPFISSYNGMSDTGWDWTVPTEDWVDSLSSYRFFIEELNLGLGQGIHTNVDTTGYAVAPLQLMDFMQQPEQVNLNPLTGEVFGDPHSPGIGFNTDANVKGLFIKDPNSPFFDAIDLLRRHGSLDSEISLIQSPAYTYVSPQKLFINGGLYKGVFAPEGRGQIEFKNFQDEVAQLHTSEVFIEPYTQLAGSQAAQVLIPTDVLSNEGAESIYDIGANPLYIASDAKDTLLYAGGLAQEPGEAPELANVPIKYLNLIKDAVGGITGQRGSVYPAAADMPGEYREEFLDNSDIDLTKNPGQLAADGKVGRASAIWRYNDHHFDYYWPIYMKKESENLVLRADTEQELAKLDFSGDTLKVIADVIHAEEASDLTSNSIKWNHSSVYSYYYKDWEDTTINMWNTLDVPATMGPSGLPFELYMPNFHVLLEEMRTLLPEGYSQLNKYANKDAYRHTTLGDRLDSNILRPTMEIIPGSVFIPSLANVGATEPPESNIPNEFESIWGYTSPASIAMGEFISPPKVQGKLPYFSEWISAFEQDTQGILADVSKVADDFKHVILMPNVMKRYEDINFSKHVMPAYIEFNFENLHPPESSLLTGEETEQQSTTITTDYGHQFDVNDPTMADILNYTGFMPLVIGFYKHLKDADPLFGNHDDYSCQISQNSSHYKFKFPFSTYYEGTDTDVAGARCHQVANYLTMYNLDNFFKFWIDPSSWNPDTTGMGGDVSGYGTIDPDILTQASSQNFDPYTTDLSGIQKFHYSWLVQNHHEFYSAGDYMTNAIAYLTDIFKMQIIDTRPEEEWNAISLWRELQEMHGNFTGINAGYTGEGQASNPATKGSTLSLLIQNFVEEKLRTFKEMIKGDPAHSETLFIEIKKFRKRRGERNLIQTFYIPMSSELQKTKFIDSQVVFGVNYEYEISEIRYVMGSLYQYGSRVVQKELEEKQTWTGVGDNSDINYKTTITNSPFIPNTKDHDDWKTTESAQLTVNVRSQATHKMTPIYFSTAYAQVRELPPTPPQVEIIPYRTCINCVYISFTPTADNYLAFPVALTREEKLADYTWQHEVGAVPGSEGNELYPTDTPGEGKNPAKDPTPPQLLCRFKSDGDVVAFESYRISEEDRPYGPLSHFDFGDPSISKKTILSKRERTTFVDELKPNVNYYYIFRSLDIDRFLGREGHAIGHGPILDTPATYQGHGTPERPTRNWSNPTDVYRVRLVKNFDSVYLDMEVKPLHYWIWQAKIKDKIPSKTFRKYLMIRPSLNQAILNTELLESWIPGEDNPYAGVNYWSNEIFPSIRNWIYDIENGEATKIKLGSPYERVISIFGSDANLAYEEPATYYKAKITSRKTGREINILFGCPTPTLHDKVEVVTDKNTLGPDEGTYEPCGDKAK